VILCKQTKDSVTERKKIWKLEGFIVYIIFRVVSYLPSIVSIFFFKSAAGTYYIEQTYMVSFWFLTFPYLCKMFT